MRGFLGRIVGWARASFGYGVSDTTSATPEVILLATVSVPAADAVTCRLPAAAEVLAQVPAAATVLVKGSP